MNLETIVSERVRAVCPIKSISFIERLSKATWAIQFAAEATEAQRAAAQAEIDAIDPLAPPDYEEDCKRLFQQNRLFRAKCISDLAFRLGKPPGQLTAAEIQAERDRIAAIYRTL